MLRAIMKALRWCLPGLAVLGVAGWLGAQRVAIAAARADNEALRREIEEARERGPRGDRPPAQPSRRVEPVLVVDEGIDWLALAGMLEGAREGGEIDLRMMLRLQRLCTELEVGQLFTELERLEGLDLDEELRRQFEGMLVGVLAEKAPRELLERWDGRIEGAGRGSGWQLARAFERWSREEPRVAAAWLDQRVAAGAFASRKLDGVSQMRLAFEGELLGELLGGDPTGAADRLAALPPEQRMMLLKQGRFLPLEEGSERSFAWLVREQVPADRRAEVLRESAAQIGMRSGYEGVERLLREVELDGPDRGALLAQVGGVRMQVGSGERISGGALREFETWAERQVPGEGARLSGEALAVAAAGRDRFEVAVELLGEIESDDARLAGFLGSDVARGRAEEARALLERVEDPALRARLARGLEGGGE